MSEPVVLRIVFHGASGAGKTTTARALGERLGRPVITPSEDDGRTVMFDWIEYVGGRHDGRAIKTYLVTVPGHLHDRSRVLVETADAVILVVDTTPEGLELAEESWQQLADWGVRGSETTGLVVQANKRDHPAARPMAEVREQLGLTDDETVIETAATDGDGVRQAFVYAVRAALSRVDVRGDLEDHELSPEVLEELLRRADDALHEPANDAEAVDEGAAGLGGSAPADTDTDTDTAVEPDTDTDTAVESDTDTDTAVEPDTDADTGSAVLDTEAVAAIQPDVPTSAEANDDVAAMAAVGGADADEVLDDEGDASSLDEPADPPAVVAPVNTGAFGIPALSTTPVPVAEPLTGDERESLLGRPVAADPEVETSPLAGVALEADRVDDGVLDGDFEPTAAEAASTLDGTFDSTVVEEASVDGSFEVADQPAAGTPSAWRNETLPPVVADDDVPVEAAAAWPPVVADADTDPAARADEAETTTVGVSDDVDPDLGTALVAEPAVDAVPDPTSDLEVEATSGFDAAELAPVEEAAPVADVTDAATADEPTWPPVTLPRRVPALEEPVAEPEEPPAAELPVAGDTEWPRVQLPNREAEPEEAPAAAADVSAAPVEDDPFAASPQVGEPYPTEPSAEPGVESSDDPYAAPSVFSRPPLERAPVLHEPVVHEPIPHEPAWHEPVTTEPPASAVEERTAPVAEPPAEPTPNADADAIDETDLVSSLDSDPAPAAEAAVPTDVAETPAVAVAPDEAEPARPAWPPWTTSSTSSSAPAASAATPATPAASTDDGTSAAGRPPFLADADDLVAGDAVPLESTLPPPPPPPGSEESEVAGKKGFWSRLFGG
jgi:signal recognition particle receptor subunit beta